MKKLIENLKYNDFIYEGGAWWRPLSGYKVVVFLHRKTNRVEILHKPEPFLSDMHGYLDGIQVKPEHAMTVINWMFDSQTKQEGELKK